MGHYIGGSKCNTECHNRIGSKRLRHTYDIVFTEEVGVEGCKYNYEHGQSDDGNYILAHASFKNLLVFQVYSPLIVAYAIIVS